MKTFFTIKDNDGMYVDVRCVFFDEIDRKYYYNGYPSYYNMVLLNDTYDKAKKDLDIIKKEIKKVKLNKEFQIVQIVI